MFSNQFLVVKNMPRKIEESLLMLLPTYVSRAHGLCTLRVILVHMAHAHYVRFLRTRPMCIMCCSCACTLYDSSKILVHLRSFTQ